MTYPSDANGDVFREMEASGFDFSIEHVVDFHAVFATEEMALQIAHLYLADHRAGGGFTNIETKPHPEGGMELALSKRMLVSYQSVTEFESTFASRIAMVDGYFDGWGVLDS